MPGDDFNPRIPKLKRCSFCGKTSEPVSYTHLYRLEDIRSGGLAGLSARVEERGLSALAQELGVGEPTLRDIVRELQKPGRDPRDDLPSPIPVSYTHLEYSFSCGPAMQRRCITVTSSSTSRLECCPAHKVWTC